MIGEVRDEIRWRYTKDAETELEESQVAAYT